MKTFCVSRRARIAGVVAIALLAHRGLGQEPDHPIITEVFNNPVGQDGPTNRNPGNSHQEFIEIYLPSAANLSGALNADVLRLTFYEIEGDSANPNEGHVSQRYDLPTFDLDNANGITPGAIARPSSGVVVIGWVDYNAQNPPTDLAGTPSSRIGLIDGGIVGSPAGTVFIALDGAEFSGTTNFPVPDAESLADVPNENVTGVVRNGSNVYLLVNRDDPGYVQLEDRMHPELGASDPDLPGGTILGVSSLLDGIAGNDDPSFDVTAQPYVFPTGLGIDLEAILRSGGTFSLLVAQIPEASGRGYARTFVDLPRTTEDALPSNDSPSLDAQTNYRNDFASGPFFPTPGTVVHLSSAPELGVAGVTRLSFDVLANSTGRPGLISANVGGDFPIDVSASPGSSSNPSIATFTSYTADTNVPGQSEAFPQIAVAITAGASNGTVITAPVTFIASNSQGGPSVINPTQNSTAQVTVLNPTRGIDGLGAPLGSTIFAAVQGLGAVPGVNNEFVSSDLGVYVAQNLGQRVAAALNHINVLLNPATNLENFAVVDPLRASFPAIEADFINAAGAPGTLDLVQTVLQSAKVLTGSTVYNASINAGETGIKAIEIPIAETATKGGTFSPGEFLFFANAGGDVFRRRSGLSWVTTARTFELALIDTNVTATGIESGDSDDFGVLVEAGSVRSGASVVPGQFIFLSFSGGLEGEDVDTLDVPGVNATDIILFDLDNLDTVLGCETITRLFVIDGNGNGTINIMEALSLNSVCLNNAQCDDGLFCNGTEVCSSGVCQAGTPPSCNDGVPCTNDTCNETTDTCDHVANDAFCDDGLFCDGTETCDLVVGCQAGSSIDCNDGVACTVDSCNEATDACENVPDDATCTDGLFCNGTETCDPVFGCQAGSSIDCNDGVACTVDSCNEATDACENVPGNASCDNGLFCDGPELCDPLMGCQAGTPPCPPELCDEPSAACTGCQVDGDCDDGVACTIDSCNNSSGACDNIPDDSLCDNGIFCDGPEVCDSQVDCQSGNPPCPPEICDESAGECTSCQNSSDCVDGNECTVDLCINAQCGNPPLLDNTPCAGGQGTCQSGECVTSGCTTNTDCDDGLLCTFDICVDNACVNTAARYADVAGPGGVCGPDGDVSLLDILAVLNGFQASFASPCDRSSIDIAGDQGACPPNGVIDLADILAVLDAFQGEQTCCPAQ